MSPTFNLLFYLLGKTKWSTSFLAGAMTSFFPAMRVSAHLHVHQTKDSDASSPTAFPFLLPSPRAEPLKNHKTREKLAWKLKEDAENTEALLSLSVVSWTVADIWVGFAGAMGGKILESLHSLPQAGSAAHRQGRGTGHHSPSRNVLFEAGHHCDRPISKSTHEHLSYSAGHSLQKIILLKQTECSSLYLL